GRDRVPHRGAGNAGALALGRRIDDVEAAAIRGFAPFAADPQIGRHIVEKIFVHVVYSYFSAVMGALVPAISLRRAQCLSQRGKWDKPGDGEKLGSVRAFHSLRDPL